MKLFKLIKVTLILTIMPMPITSGMTNVFESGSGLYSNILTECQENSEKRLHKALIDFISLNDEFCTLFKSELDEDYEKISSSIYLNFKKENNEELVENVNKAFSYFRSKLNEENLSYEKIKEFIEHLDKVKGLFKDKQIY